eukprot:COSAG01_NODE_258_length_20077_cov_124.162429_7_plen_66_part_00
MRRESVAELLPVVLLLQGEARAQGLSLLDLSAAPAHLRPGLAVSRTLPACTRSILTEIYLCHACS